MASVSLKLSYDGAGRQREHDLQPGRLRALARRRPARDWSTVRRRPRRLRPGRPGLGRRSRQPAPATFAGAYDRLTAEANPADRAALVRDFVDAAGGLETAGYCETIGSGGRVRQLGRPAGRRPRPSFATLDGVARTTGSDASARRTSSSMADLDGVVLGRRAAARADGGARRRRHRTRSVRGRARAELCLRHDVLPCLARIQRQGGQRRAVLRPAG